jgi:hypothetical protein
VSNSSIAAPTGKRATAITRSTPDYTLTYSGITWLHSINQLWLHHPKHWIIDCWDGLLSSFANTARIQRHFAQESPIQLARWMSTRHYMERAANPIYALHGLPHPRFICHDLEIKLVTVEQQQELLDVLYGTFLWGQK